MIRVAAAIALCALAAPAIAQQEPDPEDVAAMITAIEEAGCVITPENGETILEASGIAPEDVSAVVEQLYVSGALMLRDDMSAELTNEACS
ncbi:MAG: hypothetical protein GVY31_03080 [Alphaproteobacteria bacterium]|jgi:fructose-1,6-bisphosphatase/inositol monophosphatase family enzyme|nr:hypothetical protein [Alphaproteobacteria bacterium]